MESRVRSFEARRLRAAGTILENGPQDYGPCTGRSPEECQEAFVEEVGLFLTGSIDRAQFHDRTLENLRDPHLLCRQEELAPAALTALGLSALLTSPSITPDSGKLRRALRHMIAAAGCRRPLPVGELLQLAAEAHGRIDLSVQETPLHGENENAVQWADLALDSPSAGFRLIPVSVFTRGFFLEEVLRRPGTGFETGLARYHRENDKAPLLRKRHSRLSGYPCFNYYVDESGLSEIVFDSGHLAWGELFLASRIFAFYSGLEDLTLEGIPVINRL